MVHRVSALKSKQGVKHWETKIEEAEANLSRGVGKIFRVTQNRLYFFAVSNCGQKMHTIIVYAFSQHRNRWTVDAG